MEGYVSFSLFCIGFYKYPGTMRTCIHASLAFVTYCSLSLTCTHGKKSSFNINGSLAISKQTDKLRGPQEPPFPNHDLYVPYHTDPDLCILSEAGPAGL